MPKIIFQYDDGTKTVLNMESNFHLAIKEAEIRHGGIAMISDKIGINRGTLFRALNGEHAPTDRTMLKLANLLRIPVRAIAGEESDLAKLVEYRENLNGKDQEKRNRTDD